MHKRFSRTQTTAAAVLAMPWLLAIIFLSLAYLGMGFMDNHYAISEKSNLPGIPLDINPEIRFSHMHFTYQNVLLKNQLFFDKLGKIVADFIVFYFVPRFGWL